MLLRLTVLCVLAAAALPRPLAAQATPASPTLSRADQAALLDAMFRQLARRYVFPDSVPRIERTIRGRARAGAYDSATTAAAFGAAVGHDLRGFDLHFDLKRDSALWQRLRAAGSDSVAVLPWIPPDADSLAGMRRSNYGMRRAEVLPGNVGYLKFTLLTDLRFSRPAFSAALALVSSSDAVIVDLRGVPGGVGSAVQFVASAFFGPDSVPLLDQADREVGATLHTWTSPGLGAPRLRAQPVYVLVDRGTSSAGEALAFALQVTGRARVVGDRTSGAAHAGGWVPLTRGFVVFVPNARAYDPRTGRDWEGTGVQPDLAVPAADALAAAHADAVARLLATMPEGRLRRDLAWLAPLLRARATPPPAVDSALAARVVGRYERAEVRYTRGELVFVGASGVPQRLVPLPDGTYVIEDERFEPEDRIRVGFTLPDAGPASALVLLVRDGRRLPRLRLP